MNSVFKGFWEQLPRPIIGLAPMDGVTDAAFRHITAKYGKPHLVMTEFTSVEGIRAGATRLFDDFLYSPIERPIAAQLFGSDPEAFFIGAIAAAALGFDGVDINMGCPAKNVTSRGAGAALIQDPERASEIIHKTKEGIKAWAEGIPLSKSGLSEELCTIIIERQKNIPFETRRLLPVSVKTRTGYSHPVTEEWISHLLKQNLAAITLHGRTLKQLYTGEANWKEIGKAAALSKRSNTTLIGNGDITTLEDAYQRIKEYSVDGVLIGRASFGNPWIFNGAEVSLDKKINLAIEHSRLFNQIFPEQAFVRMRKHLLDYTKGHPGAREIRQTLMKVNSVEEVESILLPWLAKNS